MGINDSEADHAFGKAHGEGYSSNDTNSSNVCVSGIEGQWAAYRFERDDEYFTQVF